MILPGLEKLGDLEYMQGGGMASVYKGNVAEYGTVAVKIPRPECSLSRFDRELRIGMAIGRHPAIVYTMDGQVGSDPSRSYMMMEWINYPTLDDILEEKKYCRQYPVSWDNVSKIIFHTCVALQYAYEAARIRAHRDIKPNNIFVGMNQGIVSQVKLADFGIAAPSERSNMTGKLILGRPEYMAPERMNHTYVNQIDQRSDIYSLGAVMYECLSGVPPFSGENPMAVLAAVIKQDVVPIQQKCRGLDSSVSAIVMKCLAKSPNSRYASVAELAEAIRQISDVSLLGLQEVIELKPIEQVKPSEALDMAGAVLAGESNMANFGYDDSFLYPGADFGLQGAGSSGKGFIIVGIVLLILGLVIGGAGCVFNMFFTAFGAICGVLGLIFFLVGVFNGRQQALPRDFDMMYSFVSDVPVDQANAMLQVISGNAVDTKLFLYDYSITCGRGENVDLKLPEQDVGASRVHANILYQDGHYFLHNCSRNGTLINGNLASQPVMLQVGDRIQMGQTQVEFRHSNYGF